jgi:hypothetical protein
MTSLDTNTKVIGWSNEEIVIPYLSPVDNRYHRYFPDFYVEVLNSSGNKDCMILEVKPYKQSVPPEARKKMTKSYINEVMTYGVNDAKWKAATEYCNKRNWKFKVITEKDIF